MKRMRKISVALLSVAMVCAPILSSCGGNEQQEEPADVTLKSIAITTQPNKVDYEVGDIFDPTGMVVTANYSDGSSEVVTDYSYSKLPLDESDTKVTISYKGKSATVAITVKFVLKVKSIEVETMPTKTNYVVGETFDPTGMKITARWTDNTKSTVSDYTIDKTGPLTKEDTTVTISYEGFTTTINITVEDEKIVGLEITKNPTKMAYLVGETFDPTGMEISTVTNAGNKVAVDMSTVSYDKTEPLTLEDTTITFTYNSTMTVQLTISVSEAKLIGIKVISMPTKTEYRSGDYFDPSGMKIGAVYEGDKVEEIQSFTYDKKSPLTVDDTVVTISYAGFTCEIEITVNAKIVSVDVDAIETIRVEAEDLDTSNATLRDDFIAAGRGFIENGADASNGQNICGYNPGSYFEIPISSDKDFEIIIVARMSDTNLNYKINDGLEFKLDEDILTADDVQFEYSGGQDYWNWKEFKVGKVTLSAGNHTFRITSKTQRPNLDCFDFMVVKYGDEVAEKKATKLTLKTEPTKLNYEVGETFDPTGMVIEATYNDYTTKELTSEEYTIDKTGPLTEADDKVIVSYNGLTLEIPIVVGKVYDVKINGLGDKRFEAESLDTTDFIMRPEYSIDQGYVVNSSESSGGQSIERFDVGSKTSMDIFVAEDSKSILTMNVSYYDNAVFDELVTVKLDDTILASNNPELGHRYDGDYYNWQSVNFGSLDLTKGEHTLTIEFTGGHPNLDYINFNTIKYGEEETEHTLKSIYVKENPAKVTYLAGETFDPTGMVIIGKYSDSLEVEINDYTILNEEPLTTEDKSVTIKSGDVTCEVAINVRSDVDFKIEEATEYKFEAENVDKTFITSDGGDFVEVSGAVSSNERNLGHVAGGHTEILFSTSEEFNLTIDILIAHPEAKKVSEQVKNFIVDGKVITYEDQTLGATEGNQYWNYKTVTLEVGKLAKGNHAFEIEFNDGGNYDYFNFKFTK